MHQTSICAGLALMPHNVWLSKLPCFIFFCFTGFLFKPQTTMCIFLEMACWSPLKRCYSMFISFSLHCLHSQKFAFDTPNICAALLPLHSFSWHGHQYYFTSLIITLPESIWNFSDTMHTLSQVLCPLLTTQQHTLWVGSTVCFTYILSTSKLMYKFEMTTHILSQTVREMTSPCIQVLFPL